MLSDYVGEERFLEGVSRYLKDHLYGNSVTRDLWDGISAATGEPNFTLHGLRGLNLNSVQGQDIPRLMDNWITKVFTIYFPFILH